MSQYDTEVVPIEKGINNLNHTRHEPLVGTLVLHVVGRHGVRWGVPGDKRFGFFGDGLQRSGVPVGDILKQTDAQALLIYLKLLHIAI